MIKRACVLAICAWWVLFCAALETSAQQANTLLPKRRASIVLTACPPGVAGTCPHLVITDERTGMILDANPGPARPIGDPRVLGEVLKCTQDSDCPGVSRCLGGICGRNNIWCNADSECKYSEFCDLSQPSGTGDAGKCVPRGGHY